MNIFIMDCKWCWNADYPKRITVVQLLTDSRSLPNVSQQKADPHRVLQRFVLAFPSQYRLCFSFFYCFPPMEETRVEQRSLVFSFSCQKPGPRNYPQCCEIEVSYNTAKTIEWLNSRLREQKALGRVHMGPEMNGDGIVLTNFVKKKKNNKSIWLFSSYSQKKVKSKIFCFFFYK